MRRVWIAALLAASALPGGVRPALRTAQADEGPAPQHVVIAKKAKVKRLRVRKIRPRSGRTFVPLDTTIKVRFSRPIDPESVSTRSVIVRRLLGDPILYQTALASNGRKLLITPVGPLDPAKDYEVVVGAGLRSADGRELASEKRSIFFTDASVQPFRYLHPEEFSEVPTRMFEGRAAHSDTTLADGRVLLAGGQRDYVSVTGSADVFDPDDESFRPVISTMVVPRAYHVSVPFAGGAMIIGGWSGLDALSDTELFDASVGEFRDLGRMNERRDFVAAVALDDGRILVVGGLSYGPSGAEYSGTAEIYVPGIGWQFARGEMSIARAGHALTVLGDGRVLVTGGEPPGGGALPRAEIFDPDTERFTLVATPALERRQLHTATLLPNLGWVLIADGGVGRAELFDPVAERFFDAGGASFVRRTRTTASLIGGDRVLFAGGLDARGDEQLILDGMDVFIPGQGGVGRVVRGSVVFPEPRAGHTATNLPGGRVLFAGGFGSTSSDSLRTAILFNPLQ